MASLIFYILPNSVQTCIRPSRCHCHSLSLASVKSGLVLPFWYRLTRVVPDKGSLNECVCVCVCTKLRRKGALLPSYLLFTATTMIFLIYMYLWLPSLLTRTVTIKWCHVLLCYFSIGLRDKPSVISTFVGCLSHWCYFIGACFICENTPTVWGQIPKIVYLC